MAFKRLSRAKKHHPRRCVAPLGAPVPFPKVIASIIAEYAAIYVLRDFMAGYPVNMGFIWANRHAFDYLSALGLSIEGCSSWITCNSNPRAVAYLEQHPEKIMWSWIHENSVCGDIVKRFGSRGDKERSIPYAACAGLPIDAYIDAPRYMRNYCEVWPLNMCRRYWSDLSMNTSDQAVDLLLKYPQMICWNTFSMNTNPRAVAMLLNNKPLIDWFYGSMNPGLADLILDGAYSIQGDLRNTRMSENTDVRVLKYFISMINSTSNCIWANPSIFELSDPGPLIALLT